MVCASALSFHDGKICALQEPSIIIIIIIIIIIVKALQAVLVRARHLFLCLAAPSRSFGRAPPSAILTE